MSRIVEALAHVQGILQAAGVNATTDPRDLHLPGVLVGLATIDPTLAASTVRVRLLLVAPDNGQPYRLLDDLLDTVEDLVDGPATAASVTLPNHNPAPLPALEAFTLVLVEKE